MPSAPPPLEPLGESWQRALAVVAHPDDLEYGSAAARRAIARAVRRRRPDVVVTGNFRDTWDGATMLNQADHIATGRAVLDAVRDAGNRWVFRDLVDEGLEPWGGVRQVWAAWSPESRHAVDVTGTFDVGVASLRAHEAYLLGLGEQAPDPAEFLEAMAGQAGSRLGCRLAAAFEVYRM